MKRDLKYILFLLLLLVILLAGMEGGLRFLGFKPDIQAESPQIAVIPEGTFFRLDTLLGYSNKPGRLILEFPYNYRVVCTHDSAGLRITRPLAEDSAYLTKPAVWLFGCSNTYGWSLNDWESYPWILQTKNPGVNILNFSVSGFGTVQSLIQLRDALQTRPHPTLVVLAYAAMHERRNILSASRRKTATVYNYLGPMVQPYARLLKGDSLVLFRPVDIHYNRVPLSRHSAIVHFVERAVNTILQRLSNSEDVSLALILEMDRECRSAGIPFVVAGIARDTRTADMLKRCAEAGIPVTDISLSNHSGIFSNDPYDGHPNALANRYYAGQLNRFLRQNHLPDD